MPDLTKAEETLLSMILDFASDAMEEHQIETFESLQRKMLNKQIIPMQQPDVLESVEYRVTVPGSSIDHKFSCLMDALPEYDHQRKWSTKVLVRKFETRVTILRNSVEERKNVEAQD